NGGGWSIAMNNARPPFNDARVRKAIDMAIDRVQFNKTRRFGNKNNLMDTIDRPGTLFYDKSLRVPKYDLAGAQKLIDEVFKETGKPITFTMHPFNAPNYVSDAEQLLAQLQKLKNVNISLDPVSASSGYALFFTGNFDIIISTEPNWYEPAVDMINM